MNPETVIFQEAFRSFSRRQQEAIFAALAAMVADVHAPQDQLGVEHWIAAEEMYRFVAGHLDRMEGTKS